MSWSFSFELLPGEEIVDDSTRRERDVIKAAYSVFLTNKRVIFRFDGMGSYLSNAFYFSEILDARPATRLFVHYLMLRTKRKEYLLNIPEPEHWIKLILEAKDRARETASELKDIDMAPVEKRKRILLDMLTVLHKNGILDEREFEGKIHLLDSIK